MAERNGYTKIASLLKPLTKITSRYIKKSAGSDYKNMCLGVAGHNAITCNIISNSDLNPNYAIGIKNYTLSLQSRGIH